MLAYVFHLSDLAPITPELILLIWSAAILMVMAFVKDHYRHRNVPFYFSLAAIILAGIAYLQQAAALFALAQPEGFHPVCNRMYSGDGLSLFFKGIFLLAGLFTVLVSQRFLVGCPCSSQCSAVVGGVAGSCRSSSRQPY